MFLEEPLQIAQVNLPDQGQAKETAVFFSAEGSAGGDDRDPDPLRRLRHGGRQIFQKRFRKTVGEGGSLRAHLIFDLLFDTGLRLGELTALNVGDVSGRDYLTVVGKGRKERTIPIGAGEGRKDIIEDIFEWKRSHRKDVGLLLGGSRIRGIILLGSRVI